MIFLINHLGLHGEHSPCLECASEGISDAPGLVPKSYRFPQNMSSSQAWQVTWGLEAEGGGVSARCGTPWNRTSLAPQSRREVSLLKGNRARGSALSLAEGRPPVMSPHEGS